MSCVAIHYWQGRVAPVFDAGGRILVVRKEKREDLALVQHVPVARAEELVVANVEHLICGAISRPMREAVVNRGIEVTCFVAGDVEAVLEAWNLGQLDASFAMPGCRGAMSGACRGRGNVQHRRTLCHRETELDRGALGLRPDGAHGCARTRIRRTGKGLERDVD